jgi:hypothetical protein
MEQIQGLSKRKTEALVAQQLPPAKVKRETIRKVAVSQALPPAEDIKKVQSRLKAEGEKLPKQIKKLKNG